MTQIPVFSFVAYSGTGKTTYLQTLVACLCRLGVTVGVLKHDGHDFTPDTEGKDTDRLSRAGAVVTAISSDRKTMWLDTRPRTPQQLLVGFQDVDLVLTEGYKHGPWRKIGVYRAASGKPLAASDCVAVVTDTWLDVPCPQFPLDDPEPMALWLCQNLRRSFL